jgi:hypothetical protein
MLKSAKINKSAKTVTLVLDYEPEKEPREGKIMARIALSGGMVSTGETDRGKPVYANVFVGTK